MTTDFNKQNREWVYSLPTKRFTPLQFLALPEYSGTNPTGTTPGKTWRRLDGLFDPLFRRQGGIPMWIVCQYDPDCPPEAKSIRILRFRPIITVRARTAWGYQG